MTVWNCILLPVLLLGGAMPAPYIAGEVLLRFAAGSAGQAAVAAALRDAPPGFGPLGPAVESLHERTGIPLKVLGLAGGGILARIDAARLAERTAARLEACENVARVLLLPAPAPAPEPIMGGVRPPRFAVEFRAGSPQAGCISKTGGDPPAPGRGDPAAELSRQLGIPLVGRGHDGPRLLLEIDMPALTGVLVERLKALDDIETAQPNFVMGFRPAM